jgi:hypothetical protein
MKKMNKFIMTAMTVIFFSPIIFAEEMTPLQLLEKYKANHELLKCYITQSEELTEVRDTANGDKSSWTRTLSEFRTDGNRVDSTTKRWIHLSAPGDQCPDEDAGINTVIWDGKRWISFQQNTEQAFISEKETHKNEFVSYGYSGASLNGFFWGDKKPVEDILVQASKINLRSQTENVNGVNCYIIDADTTSGKYSLWIDPEHGYNIAKAKVSKNGNDILYGRAIHQIDISDFTFSIDKVEFQKINHGWVPILAEYQISTRYTDGRVITEKTNHKRIQVNPNPDFEAIGAFVPTIPDGTDITFEGVNGIGFIWSQGKPVPKIDNRFLDDLDNATKQIKQEVKPEVVKTTDAQSKNNSSATNIPVATDGTERKNPKYLSFPTWALILAGVAGVGIGGWFIHLKRRQRC